MDMDERKFLGSILTDRGDVYMKVFESDTQLCLWFANPRLEARFDKKAIPQLAKILSERST